MSKPIARVVFSVLIALVLVIGIYTSVEGAGVKSAQAQVGIHLNGALGNYQTPHKVNSFGAQTDGYNPLEGDCRHDSMIDPDD
jgi:hypothetical protein